MTVAPPWRSRTVTSRPSLSVLVAIATTVAVIAVPVLATEVFETAYSDRMPLHTVIPEYPEQARRERVEGEVQVCFEITREGRTRRVAVRKSTHRVFEKPARQAVKQSTYAPLPDDAELPVIKACRTFRFTLEPVVSEQPGDGR